MPDFNTSQKKAIRTVSGPVLCLAGPGSGKTTAMVHRIKYMIEEEHISANHILVITFTRASAKEMEERFYSIMKECVKGCTFGTFHSVFFSILKTAYGYNASNILKEDEKFNLIRDIIRKTEIDFEDEKEMVSSIISEIGMMKSEMISLEHFYSNSVGEEIFKEIYHQYHEKLKQLRKLDFDDMMVYCYELLKERQDILKQLQEKYQYILVDEFQDINKIQYEITKMLAFPQNNLFIVGDDDQSIYGFRGSKPEIMLHFKDDYRNVTEILLDKNYRCSQNITESSLRLIKNNKVRFDKAITSFKGYEEPVMLHHMKTIKEEQSHILHQIQNYTKAGIPYRDMGIIMRTNVQARNIVNTLIYYNIPFQVRDSVPCIYDHFVVKNIFDYIRAAMGFRERELFLRIINKPKRFIKRELLADELFDFAKLKNRLNEYDWAVEKIEKLEYDLKVLSGLKPYAAVHFIRKEIGYDLYIQEYSEFRHINADELYHTLDELEEMAKQYKTFTEWFEGAEEYKKEFEEKTKRNRNEKYGVTVTTMHSAKGLEYDVVFLLEANEGMTPYKKAIKPDEIEEERRMFYVAMTRAKSHLHIYEVEEYFNKKMQPSRFLNEVLVKESHSDSTSLPPDC